MTRKMIWTLLLIMSILIPTAAFSGNVALNAPVALNGTFFTGGWGAGQTVSAQTVVDGTFLAKSQQWDQGAVWWDSTAQGGQYLTIDLGAKYRIESFIVQADDNDIYKLFYWNGSDWTLAWDIAATGGWGMQTRPDVNNNTVPYVLGAPIETSMLKFMGSGGDALYAVSEIQAFGTAVPEPGTMLLLGLGLLGLAGARRARS